MRLHLLLIICLAGIEIHSQPIEITREGHEIMSIYFAGGSYYIDSQQRKQLQAWLQGKENLHEFEILLHSHTDNIGSMAYNQYLSERRSGAVLQALEEIMIHRDDVRVKDFGEINPLYDNNSLEGRLNNRRVDIILIPPSS